MLISEFSMTPFEGFLDDYRNAVCRNDVDALLDSYNFPLTLHDGDTTVVLADAAAAEKALGMLRNFYEDLGMDRMETRYVASHRVSHDFVLVDVIWRLVDADRMPICDQRSTFALRHAAKRAKIVAVFLHEDVMPLYGNA